MIPSGMIQIGQQQVDFIAVPFPDFQSFNTIDGFKSAIAEV